MNDLVIAQVEDMIKKGADSSAFDSTLYIMDKLYKAEKNEQKWAKPNRTVFDEWNPSTRQYAPTSESDQAYMAHFNNGERETLTYHEYVYKQKKKFDDLAYDEAMHRPSTTDLDPKYTLIHSMSIAKREAWLKIYNGYLQNNSE